jgi:hypothetical protein
MNERAPQVGVRGLDRWLEDLREATRSMKSVGEALAFGLDYRKLARFRMLTPAVQWTAAGTLS